MKKDNKNIGNYGEDLVSNFLKIITIKYFIETLENLMVKLI